MKFASVRLITENLQPMVAFYEGVTGLTAERPAPPFAELVSPLATLALGRPETMGAFGDASARPATNRTAILEFRVDDVDAEFARLRSVVRDWVQGPTTMPWGNRSVLFRDPDGNLVNLFAPVTAQAVARFIGRSGTTT